MANGNFLMPIIIESHTSQCVSHTCELCCGRTLRYANLYKSQWSPAPASCTAVQIPCTGKPRPSHPPWPAAGQRRDSDGRGREGRPPPPHRPTGRGRRGPCGAAVLPCVPPSQRAALDSEPGPWGPPEVAQDRLRPRDLRGVRRRPAPNPYPSPMRGPASSRGASGPA